MNEKELPDVLTITLTAKYLGVSPSTIRNEVLRGKIKFMKIGKQYRFRKNDILKYMDEQTKVEQVNEETESNRNDSR